MVPPYSGFRGGAANHNAGNASVDAIDLTASSPEPERRQLPAQQQRLPSYFKKELRSDFGGSTRVKSERKPAEMNQNSRSQRARPVHSQHIAQLIDTTNPQALRAVLIDLCRMSPALSGAIARGLAPYSTFAQTLIKQQHQSQPLPTSRQVKNDDSNDQGSYERMKQQLTAQRGLKGPSLNRVYSPSTAAGAQRPRYAGSQSTPRFKQESPPDMGDSDSDLDSFIPGAFSPSVQQAKPNRLPLRDTSTPGTPFRAPRMIPLSAKSARIHKNPVFKNEPDTCIQCQKVIEDEFETCFYHPSSQVSSDGNTVCGNCGEPLWDVGCLLGMHVSESEAQLKRGQPGRAESPSKRPRVF